MRPATPDKVRENRLRRAALRQGLVLRMSRRRDPRALGYGRYVLTGELDGRHVFGGDEATGDHLATLDEIEMFLRSPRAERARQGNPVMVTADDARSDARKRARVTK
jgi:hypothetical protein